MTNKNKIKKKFQNKKKPKKTISIFSLIFILNEKFCLLTIYLSLSSIFIYDKNYIESTKNYFLFVMNFHYTSVILVNSFTETSISNIFSEVIVTVI